MVLAPLANIFSGHLLAIINNISVWWHVVGAADRDPGPVFVPEVAPERRLRVHRADQQLRLLQRLLLVLRAPARLPAHAVHDHRVRRLRPPVGGDPGRRRGAAKGIWRSIFYSAIGGYVLLLAFVFAVQDPEGVNDGGGGVDVIFGQALPAGWHFLVALDLDRGPAFCTTACLTSASRMTFAFSRDGAIPGSRWLSKVHLPTRSRPTRSSSSAVDRRDHHPAGAQERRRQSRSPSSPSCRWR